MSSKELSLPDCINFVHAQLKKATKAGIYEMDEVILLHNALSRIVQEVTNVENLKKELKKELPLAL